jgi:hypothetical protein
VVTSCRKYIERDKQDNQSIPVSFSHKSRGLLKITNILSTENVEAQTSHNTMGRLHGLLQRWI